MKLFLYSVIFLLVLSCKEKPFQHGLMDSEKPWTHSQFDRTKDQFTFETYYRFQLTEHLAFTPDFQWIINPSLNPDKNNLTYFGFRGRATF